MQPRTISEICSRSQAPAHEGGRRARSRLMARLGVSTNSSRRNASVVMARGSDRLLRNPNATIVTMTAALYDTLYWFHRHCDHETSQPASVSNRMPQKTGNTPSTRLVTTVYKAKKWLRPIGGTVAMTRRVFARLKSEMLIAAVNWITKIVGNVNGRTRAATEHQQLRCRTKISVASPRSGRLPTRSTRWPNPHKQTADTALDNTIMPKINESVAAKESRRNGIQKTPLPAWATRKTALYTSNLKNGGWSSISLYGTRSRFSEDGGTGTSGMRRRNQRLTIAVMKLAKNNSPYACFVSGGRK